MRNKLVALVLILLAFLAGHAQPISGDYAIKNTATGLLLRIREANSANGTPMVLYNPVNWKCMTWNFKHRGGNVYQLLNLYSGKTMQPAQAAADGVAMEEQPAQTDAVQQLYDFEPTGNNNYFIRLKGTDLYLIPADPSGKVNSAVLLSKKGGRLAQQWTIYEQHPVM
jgi:Ricin-type beta-trefoil lectin domain-like